MSLECKNYNDYSSKDRHFIEYELYENLYELNKERIHQLDELLGDEQSTSLIFQIVNDCLTNKRGLLV